MRKIFNYSLLAFWVGIITGLLLYFNFPCPYKRAFGIYVIFLSFSQFFLFFISSFQILFFFLIMKYFSINIPNWIFYLTIIISILFYWSKNNFFFLLSFLFLFLFLFTQKNTFLLFVGIITLFLFLLTIYLKKSIPKWLNFVLTITSPIFLLYCFYRKFIL